MNPTPRVSATVVCVLGMMRSGTSLVTRIVHLLGVYLGADDDLLAPNRANPSGFWEHREIIAINDALLARAGGSWYAPPVLAPGWEAAGALEDLRARARALIDTCFVDRLQWGWKDPRTCLTLPFWQTLLPSVHYIVCLRSPTETSRSLEALPWAQRHLPAPHDQGMDLWLDYTRGALDGTRRHPRLVLFYEDLLADARDEVRRIATFIENEERLSSIDLDDEILALVQPALRHQIATAGGAHPAEALYRALRSDRQRLP